MFTWYMTRDRARYLMIHASLGGFKVHVTLVDDRTMLVRVRTNYGGIL